MTYISSHQEVFYKKLFLSVSQNSQKTSCAEVSFSGNFNKNETLEQVVYHEFCEIGFTSKYKRQMCANVFWVSSTRWVPGLESRVPPKVFTQSPTTFFGCAEVLRNNCCDVNS